MLDEARVVSCPHQNDLPGEVSNQQPVDEQSIWQPPEGDNQVLGEPRASPSLVSFQPVLGNVQSENLLLQTLASLESDIEIMRTSLATAENMLESLRTKIEAFTTLDLFKRHQELISTLRKSLITLPQYCNCGAFLPKVSELLSWISTSITGESANTLQTPKKTAIGKVSLKFSHKPVNKDTESVQTHPQVLMEQKTKATRNSVKFQLKIENSSQNLQKALLLPTPPPLPKQPSNIDLPTLFPKQGHSRVSGDAVKSGNLLAGAKKIGQRPDTSIGFVVHKPTSLQRLDLGPVEESDGEEGHEGSPDKTAVVRPGAKSELDLKPVGAKGWGQRGSKVARRGFELAKGVSKGGGIL